MFIHHGFDAMLRALVSGLAALALYTGAVRDLEGLTQRPIKRRQEEWIK